MISLFENKVRQTAGLHTSWSGFPDTSTKSAIDIAQVDSSYQNDYKEEEEGAWEPGDWKGASWETPPPPDDRSGPTHQVLKDHKGRRVSVLNESNH